MTWALVVLALLYSVYVNYAIAITYQRVFIFGVPRERGIAFWHTQSEVDRWVSRVIWPDLRPLAPP